MQKNEIPLPVKHCNFPSFFIKAHNNLNQFAFPQVVKKNLDSIVKAVGDWLKWTRLLLKSKYQLNLNYPLKKKNLRSHQVEIFKSQSSGSRKKT